MSAASQYLDRLLGTSSTEGQTSATTTMESLFGQGGASAYLDRLLGGATTATTSEPAQATPAQATPARTLTEDEKKYGSWGTVADIGDVDLSNVDSVAAMAQRGGWGDPKAFSLDMLDGPGKRESAGEGGWVDTGTTKFKDDVAVARGITGTGRNKNVVYTTWKDTAHRTGNPDTNEQVTTTSAVDGYRVLAGAVPGQKRHTSLWYEYDKDGKFKGANFDVEERGLEGAAPLVGMGMMALGFGGGLSAVGSGLNSALNLGLGKVGTAALGGAAVGGGAAALTGQDPVKGAAAGAIGSGIVAANPAGAMGVTNPDWARVINGQISSAAKTTLNRK